MDLDTVADELYGLPAEDFTSTRNAREKEAKAAGDKELAARIHAFAKPNQVAWLANQLARQHAEELAPLLELGADLREATASLSGDQLRAFSRQQQQLLRALVEQARRLAAAGGKRVSEDTARGLQETLRAALADPAAAELLLAGRLSDGMQHVGFGQSGGGAASRAAPSAVRSTVPKKDQLLERAQRELESAEAGTSEALETLHEARDELTQAGDRATRLDAEVTRLRDRLETAMAEHAQATRDQRQARTAFDRAEKAAQSADRRLSQAQERRQRIADRD